MKITNLVSAVVSAQQSASFGTDHVSGATIKVFKAITYSIKYLLNVMLSALMFSTLAGASFVILVAVFFAATLALTGIILFIPVAIALIPIYWLVITLTLTISVPIFSSFYALQKVLDVIEQLLQPQSMPIDYFPQETTKLIGANSIRPTFLDLVVYSSDRIDPAETNLTDSYASEFNSPHVSVVSEPLVQRSFFQEVNPSSEATTLPVEDKTHRASFKRRATRLKKLAHQASDDASDEMQRSCPIAEKPTPNVATTPFPPCPEDIKSCSVRSLRQLIGQINQIKPGSISGHFKGNQRLLAKKVAEFYGSR